MAHNTEGPALVTSTSEAAVSHSPPVPVAAQRYTTPRGAVIEVLAEQPAGAGPFPVVVLASGSGYHMRLPLLERVARTLVEHGIGVYRFDWAYRVSNPTEGRHSEERSPEVEDLETVVRLARSSLWVDQRNVFVAGKSLGSIIAWHVLRRDATLNGALLLTPVCNKATPSVTYPELAKELRPTTWILGDKDNVCDTHVLYRFLADAPSTPHVAVLTGDHGFAATASKDAREIGPDQATLERFDLAARLVTRFVQEHRVSDGPSAVQPPSP